MLVVTQCDWRWLSIFLFLKHLQAKEMFIILALRVRCLVSALFLLSQILGLSRIMAARRSVTTVPCGGSTLSLSVLSYGAVL